MRRSVKVSCMSERVPFDVTAYEKRVRDAQRRLPNARTVRRWIRAYREHGEAGPVSARWYGGSRVDQRWTETALQIMVEHTNESKPSQAAIIYQTAKRLESCYGAGGVEERRDRSGPTASFVPRTAGSWPCQPATMCTGAPDVRMRLTLVFRRPLPLRRQALQSARS